MENKLNCQQIETLMAFYIEDCLSETLTKYVKYHLEICQECRKKYFKLKNLQNDLVPLEDSRYLTKQYEDFRNNLSAYIDNELDDEENIKIKKITIANPLARKDLEEIYNFKKLIHNSFERTKNELKTDFSKNILDMFKSSKKTDPFYRLAAAFFLMISFIVAGLIRILYF